LPLTLVFNAVQMNLGAYAQDINVSQSDVAFMVAQLSILMLIGKILFGKLSDRFDQRYLYWTLAGGMSIAIIIISTASGYALLSVGTALLGFVYAGYLPLIGAIIASRFGTRAFGQITGMTNTFLGFGAAGSFIAASLRDLSGSYALAFIAFMLLLIPAAWQMRKLK
ncbi:MAG TPA: MFS transporter, partial [Spongiibacteraceae bacterium]